MYAGIEGVYLNYQDFRRPVGGAMKLLSALFGYFELYFTLPHISSGTPQKVLTKSVESPRSPQKVLKKSMIF